MWWLALMVVGACAQDGADPGQQGPWDDDDDDADLYNRYYEEVSSSTQTMTRTQESQYTRVRRHDETTSPVRTLSPDELREVRGVLSKVMSGRDLSAFTQESVSDVRMLMDMMSSPSTDLLTDLAKFTPRSTFPSKEVDGDKPILRDREPTNVTINGVVFKKYWKGELIYPSNNMWPLEHIKYEAWQKISGERICLQRCVRDVSCMSVNIQIYDYWCRTYRFALKPPEIRLSSSKNYHFYERLGLAPTTTAEPTTLNTTTTLEITTRPNIIDIRKLVEIIANLTMNTIESNITELFNATLQKYGIPMCDKTTTELPAYDFTNATIIAKCFVCGLNDSGIPQDAYCADAFAGDFLPLVPVDPRARGQIATYRKYCRYLDVPGTVTNATQPRSVFGRWTGGCSVRWIDLSGVFTQRACRNRRHAVMGKHYVSKRMAKLEMALTNEDNGCVISPMASLVPFSRGISLYARFHACVCTGSWCNGGPPVRNPVLPRHACLAILAAWTTVALLT